MVANVNALGLFLILLVGFEIERSAHKIYIDLIPAVPSSPVRSHKEWMRPV